MKPFRPFWSCAQVPAVGGQAVMEGVMMRYGDNYGLALRHPNGEIVVEYHPWFSLTKHAWLKQPYLRGFPTLLETLVNGIRALNRSAEVAGAEDGQELTPWHLAFTLILALLLAVLLFVVAPHLLSLGMKWLGLGGDVEGLSFHIWDGIFKFGIFLGYIFIISLVPDIRRVFRYHGAEHKVIHAYEAGEEVTPKTAQAYSRLHPRCGTTFLLFVLSLAIVLHAITVPVLFWYWTPSGVWSKHTLTLVFKLFLMIPISAIAYELIRYAARVGDTFLGKK